MKTWLPPAQERCSSPACPFGASHRRREDGRAFCPDHVRAAMVVEQVVDKWLGTPRPRSAFDPVGYCGGVCGWGRTDAFECERCEKTVCYCQGALDDKPDLCNACADAWNEERSEDVP